MKTILSLAISIFVSIFTYINAQQYFEVDYKEVYNMDVEFILGQIPKEYRAQSEPFVREELKNGVSFEYQLQSNGKESVYEILPAIDNSQSSPGFISQNMRGFLKGKLYKNLTDLELKKEQDLAADPYIIVEKVPDFKWEISREKLNIAGYECKKATGVMRDTVDVVAYFAPKLAIKDGPNAVFGLPGLVLQAEFFTNGVKQVITATKIAIKEKELKIPTLRKGKEISEKEFLEKVEEFKKKQIEMSGGGVDTDE